MVALRCTMGYCCGAGGMRMLTEGLIRHDVTRAQSDLQSQIDMAVRWRSPRGDSRKDAKAQRRCTERSRSERKDTACGTASGGE